MDKEKKPVTVFCQNLATTFSPAIMAVTLAGMSRDYIVEEGLFRLGGGLAFEGIIQLFIWSCVISALITVLTSDIWFSKIMFLWRVVALMLLSIAASVAFAVTFNWIPVGDWEAWAVFLVIFVVCFGGGLVTLVAKTKFEDIRYNKLLNDYKRRANND